MGVRVAGGNAFISRTRLIEGEGEWGDSEEVVECEGERGLDEAVL